MNKEQIIKKVLEINGFSYLNPMQEKVKEYIGKNTLVCTPTASGKTFVFELYLFDTIFNKNKKVVYISPLKALTSEHYKDIKKKYEKVLNIKIGISTGDLDSSIKHLENYDVLFLTYEKFDSILRHSPKWMEQIGLLTIDEIHELGNDRGATLEIIISQIKKNYKDVVFLGLSATIGNSKSLSKWLKAELVESNYRPVPLKIGIFYNNEIYFNDGSREVLKEQPSGDIKEIIVDTLKKNKQAIIFCNSRPSTVNLSKKYSTIINKTISEKERADLKKIAKEAASVLEQPTKQCLALFNSLSSGCAFHHAGLVYKQREIIENEFRKGNIKIIFATPTLAAGINLPAFRVIINSIYRFSDGGLAPIPINEFWQMCGRAGRPKYDTTGEAIVFVNKEKDLTRVYNSYVIASPTDIESQLSKMPLLRQQLLSVILINDLKSIQEVLEYISLTFYYHEFGNDYELNQNILDLIDEFVSFNFLIKDKKDNIEITELGKKVCLLYLDPYSANNIINDLMIKSEIKEVSDTSLLFTITNTRELYPYIRYKADKEKEIFENFEKIKQEVYFDYEDLNLLQKVHLSFLLTDWINEASENDLLEKYNITPGQLQNIINNATWIIHCILELSKITKTNLKIYKKYLDLELRLKYGVKEEILELVQLKNIGKVRARKLYISGITSISMIKKNPEKFVSVVGKFGIDALKELKIDVDLKKEPEIDVDLKKQPEKKKKIVDQKKLFEF